MDHNNKQANLFEINKVIPLPLEEEIKQSYLNYAMSVIVGRALPDARDGLKPVPCTEYFMQCWKWAYAIIRLFKSPLVLPEKQWVNSTRTETPPFTIRWLVYLRISA